MVELVVRPATPSDVAAICAFGEAHVPRHYTPLLGAALADDQVRTWWNEQHIHDAVGAGRVVVADLDGRLAGVAQRGLSGADHVIYKLYLDPAHRGHGIGPKLIQALVAQLPADVSRVFLEHFAANVRAGDFYEREGFRVERIEPSATGDRALDVVWRVRDIP